MSVVNPKTSSLVRKKVNKGGVGELYKKVNKELEVQPSSYQGIPWLEVERRSKYCGGKYHTQMPMMAFELLNDATQVQTMGSLAMHLGLSRQGLWDAMEREPQLKRAIELGKSAQEVRFAQRLAIDGMKYSQGLIFVLKNLHGWTDKMETKTEITLSKQVSDLAKSQPVAWEDIEVVDIDAGKLGPPKES